MRMPIALMVVVVAFVIAGCSQQGDPVENELPPALAAVVESAVDQPTPSIVSPTASPAPTEMVEPSVTPSPDPTAVPTATPTIPPTATPDPYAGLSIDELAARSYGGGLLEIVDTLETNESFTRYLITYPSDDLTIYGFMNVPNEGDNFPVALVLHGYIDRDEYEVVPYTRRYADALAEAGYFVIHPNFRNHPPSDNGPDPFRIGYAIDTLNLIAVIREQSQDPLGTLRRADVENIHLWGHSMGGGVSQRVLAVNNEPYLRAAVLYGSMSGDEGKNYGRIRGWTGGQGGRFETRADAETLAQISAETYLDRINAAIAVHHSYEDDVVPVEWSETLCTQLNALYEDGDIAAPPACYFYEAQPHTFRGNGDLLFMERTAEFFDTH